MNDSISYQANPETRGTGPIQFFEAGAADLPSGTKATSRPADRPRELPPTGPAVTALQVFECADASGDPAGKATARPAGRERALDGLSAPSAPPGQGG
jgi:hypothetical protein